MILPFVFGCREDTGSPVGPDAIQETAAAPAATLQPKLAAMTAPLSFIQVSLRFTHACDVTTDHRAYFRGGNQRGQLGNGTTNAWEVQTTPVAVAGAIGSAT